MSEPLYYPRPATLARLGPGCNVVESSAGTGKTYLLEHLFVDLILSHGVPAEQILVVTFTEKATSELVLRLRNLLGELAGLGPGHPKAIAASGKPADEAWVLDDPARQRLGDALLAFDRISIFTIHGFCQRMLREHAFGQGRLFDEELVGRDRVFADAVHATLRTRVATDAQLAALVEAHLASGKSIKQLRELLYDCDHAKADALRPELDEARLATALAAWQPVTENDDQLRARLKAAKVHGSTINGVLRHLAKLSEVVAETADRPLRFLTELHATSKLDLAYVVEKLASAPSDPALAALTVKVRELYEVGVPLEAALAQGLLPVVRERAAQAKRTAGLLDFDDMITLLERALAEPTRAGRALVAALRGRYRHALIDEFQDTDQAQWSIFHRVFVEAGGQHGLTVIGDPKQAIYGFRGANVHTYLGARAALVKDGANQVELDRNFRSTAAMIAATNLIFDQGASFFRPASGIRYDQPVACGQPQRLLLDESARPVAPVVLFDLDTPAATLKADAARAAAASAIVSELGGLRAAGRVPLRNVFVLTFTNRDNRRIGRALAEARIPFAFYKQDKLFETAEAGELLDVLRALCAPEDRGRRGLALLSRCFGLDLAEVAAGAEASAGPAQLLARLAALADTGDIPRLFSALVEETGLLRRELFAGAGERSLTNFTHLLELLQAESARSHASLPRLVDLLEGWIRGTAQPPGRDSDLQRLPTDANAVQVLTVYKAKGLEADVVFLFGGVGDQPHGGVRVVHEGSRRLGYVGALASPVKTRYRDEQYDEHCRLLYVALTRARDRLYLPHYPTKFRTLAGPYRRLNQRLDEIVQGQAAAGFERRRVDTAAAGPADRPAPTAPPCEVDPVLLESPRVPSDVAQIRSRRKGFLVTSYTAVKRARGGLHPVEETAERSSPGEHHAAATRVPEALPGGSATGIFLHELLARVDLGELAARPDFATWFAQPKVARLFERQRRLHGRPAGELGPAGRLVHAAYTTELRAGSGSLAGLARVTSPLRELEFLYPMPEAGHPLLSRRPPAGGERPWRIDRGVVKGFIDLLYQHEGRVFVLDWKSDVLDDYGAHPLASHCAEHYDVQARLYTIAALRLCGIAERLAFENRFGGVIFYFLRGRQPGDERAGIHAVMPAWADVLGWERDMIEQPFWGLGR